MGADTPAVSLAQPKEMLLQFEKAATNSLMHVWPETVVECYFFHLTQNVWRKVQAAGMQADYSQDEELAIRIRQLPTLAFANLYDDTSAVCEVAQQLPISQASEAYSPRRDTPGSPVPSQPLELLL